MGRSPCAEYTDVDDPLTMNDRDATSSIRVGCYLKSLFVIYIYLFIFENMYFYTYRKYITNKDFK